MTQPWRIRRLELVLPEAAELGDIPGDLLAPKVLPTVWAGEQITAQAMLDYFTGTTVVQVDKGGFQEPVPVPKASADVVNTAIGEAVLAGKVWLLSGPASLLAEPIPAGVLTPASILCVPPPVINVAEILPANLPTAWTGEETNALAIATALSQKAGKTLPWKTVKDVIGASLNARFTQLGDGSAPWPCDLPAAQTLKLKIAPTGGGPGGGGFGGTTGGGTPPPTIRVAEADFEPSQIQDLGDLIPALLELKAKCKVPMKFRVRLELGDGRTAPSDAVIKEVNALLIDLDEAFQI